MPAAAVTNYRCARSDDRWTPCSLSAGRWCEFPARCLLDAGASSLLAVFWTLVRVPCSPSAVRWCELPARRLLDAGASSLLAVCRTLVRASCSPSAGHWCEFPARCPWVPVRAAYGRWFAPPARRLPDVGARDLRAVLGCWCALPAHSLLDAGEDRFLRALSSAARDPRTLLL